MCCALTFSPCVQCSFDVNLGGDYLLVLVVSIGEMSDLIHGVP